MKVSGVSVGGSAASLIGTTGWDPRGESILTVVEKLSIANQLARSEMSAVAGIGDSSIPRLRSNPEERSSIAVERLLSLAGWAPDVLDASFAAHYRISGSDCGVPNAVFFDISGSMRLCPECAAHGVHLLLHQFAEFALCPLHGQRLIEQCPRCRGPLCPFRLPPAAPHSFRCTRCRWAAWDGHQRESIAGQRRRLERIAALERWLKDVERALSGGCSTIQVIDRPRRMRYIARLAVLVPAPSWLTETLRQGTRVRTVNIDLRTRPEPHRLHCRSGRAPRPLEPSEHLCSPIQRRVRTHVRCLDEQLPVLYNPECLGSSARFTAFGCRLFSSEFTTVAATAIEWWRRCLQPLFPDGELQSDRIDRFEERQRASALRKLWFDGPGRFYDSAPHAAGVFEPGGIIDQWMSRTLRDLFLGLLVRASIEDKAYLPLETLHEEAIDLGALPMHALADEGAGSVLRVATTLAPEREFRALFASGYTGNATCPVRESGGQPLLALAGLDPPAAAAPCSPSGAGLGCNTR